MNNLIIASNEETELVGVGVGDHQLVASLPNGGLSASGDVHEEAVAEVEHVEPDGVRGSPDEGAGIEVAHEAEAGDRGLHPLDGTQPYPRGAVAAKC